MSWWKPAVQPITKNATIWQEQRKEPRISGRFKVRYSGTHAEKIIMGHAMVVDLSRHGFGLRGGRGIKAGMELALFLELPDTDDRLCIPQAFVSWTKGHRFGVELRGSMNREPVWIDCVAG
jgi:hypothetical protein